MADKQANVNTPSALYLAMLPNWKLVDTLNGGTRAMREAGGEYLPKEPGESHDAYTVRLSRTFLFPGLKRSIQALVGKVFSKPITVAEDAPTEVTDWSEDIDLQGRTLESFSQELFELALRKGLCHIHVDYPRVEGAESRTLEEERVSGARPYLRIVDPSDVIFWWSEQVAGAESVLEIRIREKVRERDGEYGEKMVEQVRVLKPQLFEVWRKAGDKEDSWEKVEEGAVSYPDGIPWVTVYTGRDGFMRATPPLVELAQLNVNHWQSSSDQRNILRFARMPFLFGAGMRDEEVKGKDGKMELGANRMIIAGDPDASMQFVEHTGAAIEAGRTDLEDLKADMAALGMELLVRRPGNETATARAIDTAEVNSVLQAMAIETQGALSQAIGIALKWVSKEPPKDGNLVIMNTDFGLTMQGQEELDALVKARLAGDLSRETFWAELKRRGILRDDFDEADEKVKLDSEMPPPGNEDDLGGLPNDDDDDEEEEEGETN